MVQTGAWLMVDRRSLSEELEAFIEAGEPPILFSFGSMLAPLVSGSTLIAAARALGYRAIVIRGWADLVPPGESPDWMSVGETNLQALLPRVAAIVHHGGSGTTTQAMRSGTPQVVVPHNFDQPYFAHRVAALGIGIAHPPHEPTAASMAEALRPVPCAHGDGTGSIAGHRGAHRRYGGGGPGDPRSLARSALRLGRAAGSTFWAS